MNLFLLACPALPAPLPVAAREASVAWEAGADTLEAWRGRRLPSPGPEGLRLVLECWDATCMEALESAVPDAILEEWTRGDAPWLQVTVPYEELQALVSLPQVQRIREPHLARGLGGEVTSEGVSLAGAPAWQDEGLSGRRVDVAVLDVGFQGYTSLLGSDLPDRVDTSFRAPEGLEGHGTAVAEILYDMAPRARLDLYTFSTDVEFLAALEDIQGSGVEVVNGSIGFDNVWPADGTSPVTQAVDRLATESGILYVAAAGNENDRYRSGPLQDLGGGEVALDGHSFVRAWTGGGWASVSFRWSDPYEAASNDLDLVITRPDGTPCATGQERQDGDDPPYERASCLAGTDEVQVQVRLVAGTVDGLEGHLYSSYGLAQEEWTGSRNLTLPGDTVEGITVGAVDASAPQEVLFYSSRGPTEDGRSKPEVVAPSGVSTVTFGARGFGGTSAAVPHVTGAAALVLQADRRHMEPSQVRDLLVEQAADIGQEGWDPESGAGLLRLDAIPWRGCHCGHGDGGGGAGLPLVALGLLVRRRRPGAGEKSPWQGILSICGAWLRSPVLRR